MLLIENSQKEARSIPLTQMWPLTFNKMWRGEISFMGPNLSFEWNDDLEVMQVTKPDEALVHDTQS
jgi:hypothetical protein